MGLFQNVFKKGKESTRVKKKPISTPHLDRPPSSSSRPTSSLFGTYKKPQSGLISSTAKQEKAANKKSALQPTRVSKTDAVQLRNKRGEIKPKTNKISTLTANSVTTSSQQQKARTKRPVTAGEISEAKRPGFASQSSPKIVNFFKPPGSQFTSTPKDTKDAATYTPRKKSTSSSSKRLKADLVFVKRHAESRTGTPTSAVSDDKRLNNDNNNHYDRRDLNLEQIKLSAVPFVISASVTPVVRKEIYLVKQPANGPPGIVKEKNKDGHQQDNLSRTSSITNLESSEANKLNQKSSTKPRKSSSRERIDKIQEKDKKYDGKRGVTKNNNKLDAGGNSYSLDSLQEEEVLLLKRQLQEMANEKTTLALQLGEQKGQLNNLQKEILKLKSFQEESNLELEKLSEENTILRNRLRDVAHSPLSDSEKQQLLFESHRHHNSAPASIATNVVDDAGGDNTACTTPDWDKYSSSNVSEVSVACLQDKINQMQETHYSTNEELQATLQELTDLQRQLTELQQENERLNEEKTLMFDSLCRQTERLNDSRQEVESLKQLLYREKDENGQYETAVEREQKLVDLLKSAQEERESLLVKLEQLNSEVQELRAGNIDKSEDILQLSERVRTLECTLDAKHAEHKQLDQELAIAKDQCSNTQIEINRLTDLLETARTKINELEQDRTLSDKSELDELLDNARKEKDQFESEVTYLKEQLARSKNENEKLKEQVFILQEECKVTRNNAKTTQSDLEYKCERLLSDKNTIAEQLQQFQEAVSELQVQTQCHLEDKRQLSAVLSETQRNLSEAERKNINLDNEIQELKKLQEQENEEWEKFQNDLLTSVRVANDFKTEAQQELQKFILENKTYRERVRLLEGQVEKLKGEKHITIEEPIKEDTTKSIDTPDNMDTLFPVLQPKRTRDKPRKSKESIEPLPSNDKADKKADLFGKLVKKREKKPINRANKTKTPLSVEEELLLQSLDDWYSNIDQNIPEECLTPEEKAVKKLKFLFQEDSQKEKPIAKKPKAELAISKPFLNSVLLNPKLVEIVNDPKVPTVNEENQLRMQQLVDDNNFFVVRDSHIPTDDRYQRVNSEDFGKKNRNSKSKMHKSKSLDNLNIFEEHRKTVELHALYRSVEAQNLSTIENFEIKQAEINRISEFSEILPSDSVSNLNYPSTQEIRAHRKSKVRYGNLDDIINNIPKDCPEEELKKEEKFALRLKRAFDDAKHRPGVRKIKLQENVEISSPTQDSVEQNVKLKEIILNPKIKKAEEKKKSNFFISIFSDDKRNSIQIDDLNNKAKCEKSTLGVQRSVSKSYEDINFEFMPEKTLINMYSSDSAIADSPHANRRNPSFSPASSVSFTSGEFNVVTGTISPNCNVTVENVDGNSDLLYNETLLKHKPKEFDQDQIEYERDPELQRSIRKYKKDLNKFLEGMDKEIRIKNRHKSLKNIESLLDIQGQFEVPVVEPVYYDVAEKTDDEEISNDDVIIRSKKKPVAQERRRIKNTPSSSQQKLDNGAIEPLQVFRTVDYDQDDSNKFQETIVKETRFEVSKVIEKPLLENVVFATSITVDALPNNELILNEDRELENMHNNRMSKTIENVLERPLVSETHSTDHNEFKSSVLENVEYQSPQNVDLNTQFEESFTEETKDNISTTITESKSEEPATIDYDLLNQFLIEEKLASTSYVKDIKYEDSSTSNLPEFKESNLTIKSDGEELEPVEIKSIDYDSNVISDEPHLQHLDHIEELPRSYEDIHLQPPYVETVQYHSPILQDAPFGQYDFSENIIQNDDVVDANLFDNDEYSYKHVLKENKYGVVSPMNLRHTYKNVVKEIKTKFPSVENLTEIPKEEESDTGDTAEDSKFMDDFFGVTTRNKKDRPAFSSSESIDSSSSTGAHRISRGVTKETVFIETNSSRIDQEMQEILEKYLHTRASLIVRDAGSPKIEKEDKKESKGNLKKFNNVENLHEIHLSDKCVTSDITSIRSGADLENPKMMLDVPHKNEDEFNSKNIIVDENLEETLRESENIVDATEELTGIVEEPVDNEEESLTEEDSRFIEEMTKKYSAHHAEITEVNDNDTLDVNLKTISFTDKEIEDKYQHLSEEELELIRSVKKDRFSRPLSDINEIDLALIEEVTKRYFLENDEIKSTPDIKKKIEDIGNTTTAEKTQEQKLDDGLSSQDEIRIENGDNINKEESLTKIDQPDGISTFDRNLVTRHSLLSIKNKETSHHRRQIKSWTDFQKRTLDDVLHYEPVYSNFTLPLSKNIVKRTSNNLSPPLPVPRPNTHSADVKKLTVTDSNNEFDRHNDNLVKMTDSEENFCEGKGVTVEVLNKEGSSLEKVDSGVSLKIKELNSSVEPNIDVISNHAKENVVSAEMSSTNIKDEGSSTEGSSDAGQACSLSPTNNSYSAIEIAGKFEQLDLTKLRRSSFLGELDDIEEIARRNSDQSNVNLFNIESPSYDESYLNMFQTKEQEMFDKLSGKRKPVTGYFDITYVEEMLDDDSVDDVTNEPMFKKHEAFVELSDIDSKPKIVDFVPLDDETKPYFTKADIDNTSSSYDTLERERTFHVLSTASKVSKTQINANSNTDVESKFDTPKKEEELEVLAKQSSSCSKASSKSVTDTSRSSFSQAKKIFEALVEANNTADVSKDKGPSKSKPKFTVKTSKSSVSTESIHVIKSDGNISKPVGETILVVKEGKSVVIDPEEK